MPSSGCAAKPKPEGGISPFVLQAGNSTVYLQVAVDRKGETFYNEVGWNFGNFY